MLKRKRTSRQLGGIRTKSRLFVRRHVFISSVAAIAITTAAIIWATVPTHAANGLIGAWKLDEGTGTTTADTSGNGINGTIVRGTSTGSPAWVSPGHDGTTANALDFDGSGTVGTASNTVDLGTDSRLDQMDHYTISLWVKFKAGYVGNGGAWANLVGRNSSPGNWAWMIYVNSSGHIRPHHRNSNGTYVLNDSAAVMPIGQWVHIEQVADGSRLHLYINGKEDPNFPISYSGTTMSLPTAHVYIGQDKRESAPLATISDVRIYNDASVPPQVATSAATNVTQSSAKLNGTLTTLGDFTTAKVFFRYRVAGSSGSYTETAPQTVNAAGGFSANVSGLSGSTQYEFQPVVEWEGRNGAQETSGQLLTFTTPAYGVITQAVDSLTSEDGDTGSFSVCLSVKPSAAVTIALSSSNTDEGTVPASVTIQPDDWNKCGTNLVTVTGVDDSPPVGDDAAPYTIVTGDVTSADPNFNALTGSDVADIDMINQNNDPPGIVMSLIDDKTSENGGTVRAQFRLLSAPTADVTIPLSLSDTSEGSLGGVTSITITPANWDQPQNNEVVITGVDDDLTDGDVTYTLQTGDPTSADAGYNALTDSSVADGSLLNIDNDTAGVTVAETGGSTDVTEGSTTDSFSVVLDTQPGTGKNVVVTLQPDAQVDLGNGPGVAAQLTFTNANWDNPQNVTVTATDDSAVEGSHNGLIAISIDPSTTESSYLAVDPADVTAHITDNDDDNDGISAADEDVGPNSGDANNDGTPDSHQPNVTTFIDPLTSRYVSVAAEGCTDGNSDVSAISASSLGTKDSDYTYPAGLVNFTLNCADPGDAATVTLYFFGVNPGGMVLRKYNPTTHTYQTISGATITSVTIGGQQAAKATYSITDGGTLDADGTADGTIIDPAGLAKITSSQTSGSSSTPGAPNTGYGILRKPINIARALLALSIILIIGIVLLFRHKQANIRS